MKRTKDDSSQRRGMHLSRLGILAMLALSSDQDVFFHTAGAQEPPSLTMGQNTPATTSYQPLQYPNRPRPPMIPGLDQFRGFDLQQGEPPLNAMLPKPGAWNVPVPKMGPINSYLGNWNVVPGPTITMYPRGGDVFEVSPLGPASVAIFSQASVSLEFAYYDAGTEAWTKLNVLPSILVIVSCPGCQRSIHFSYSDGIEQVSREITFGTKLIVQADPETKRWQLVQAVQPGQEAPK